MFLNFNASLRRWCIYDRIWIMCLTFEFETPSICKLGWIGHLGYGIPIYFVRDEKLYTVFIDLGIYPFSDPQSEYIIKWQNCEFLQEVGKVIGLKIVERKCIPVYATDARSVQPILTDAVLENNVFIIKYADTIYSIIIPFEDGYKVWDLCSIICGNIRSNYKSYTSCIPNIPTDVKAYNEFFIATIDDQEYVGDYINEPSPLNLVLGKN